MSQKEYDTFSIGPVKLGPSLQEGEFGVPSILSSGEHPAIELVRTAPALLINPIMLGSIIIPSTLTTTTGVFSGSPSPDYTYEWLRDGVVIPGENGNTYTTSIVDHDHEIGSRVTATSFLGSVSADSNVLLAQIYEDIESVEFEAYIFTGMQVNNAQMVVEMTPYIITGLSILNTAEVSETEIYVITD